LDNGRANEFQSACSIKYVHDHSTNSSSFAYLFSYDSPRPISDSEKELKSIMDAMCDKMSILPYKNGYIFTGSDRLGGQLSWA